MVYNLEECRKLGRLIQERRKELAMSQEALAELLGVSRVTVTHMELHGRGLRDIFTRRDVAKALGLSPVIFSVLGTDSKPEILYDKTILQKSFELHVENYFTTGTVTLSDVDMMMGSIFTIFKSLDHKDIDVLKILHGYSWLGICLAREKLDGLEIRKYIGLSVNLGEEINNPVLLARTYTAAASAFYTVGERHKAIAYAEKGSGIRNVPSHVHGNLLLDAGTSRLNPHLIDEALTIVQNNPHEEDIAYVRLSPDICQIRKAMVLLDKNDTSAAEEIIADAEESTPLNMIRRQCMIQWLRARVAMQQGSFDQAAFSTLSAIPLAKQINSAPNIERLRSVHAGLLESGYAQSRDVKLIGMAL